MDRLEHLSAVFWLALPADVVFNKNFILECGALCVAAGAVECGALRVAPDSVECGEQFGRSESGAGV